MKQKEIREKIRERYGKIARKGSSCCPASSCELSESGEDIGRRIGYSDEDIKAVPEGANLGLGSGNPVKLASLREGEAVLDLGSGAGIDCFMAAAIVGPSGRVVGIDMTPEMIEKGRENARAGNFENVEFRLGEIENLPFPDSSFDAVISNCVINLSQDKRKVFHEAYRVLKPGGRLIISDIVLLGELPDFVKDSIDACIGCVSGAMMKDEYLKTIKGAGFRNVRTIGGVAISSDHIAGDPAARELIKSVHIHQEDIEGILNNVASMYILGMKL